MDQLPASPSYVTWLLGQSVAVVVLVAWVVTLIRQSKRLSEDNRRLQSRNDELSDSLVDLVQSKSQELLDANERRLSLVLEKLENALFSKRSG